MRLTPQDEALLAGEEGEGVALAMEVLVDVAHAMGAASLLDIVSAHVDGCLYHGAVSLDFARRLLAGGATVKVPTTLNVGSVDLLHPELVRRRDDGGAGKELMQVYVELGCRATWTCAPYQLLQRPGLGEQIAWAESNAIVFANSVLGARTERYGDFLDICAAVTGRAPAVGLHLDEGRRATMVIDVTPLGDLLSADHTYPLLGLVVGYLAGREVAAITGLPADTDEDRLKALGASAASCGSVAMFHAVGLTPEAPDVATAAGGAGNLLTIQVVPEMLRREQRGLQTAPIGRVDAVCLGTPHYSARQMERLADLVDGRTVAVPLYVNTGRDVLAGLSTPVVDSLAAAGVRVVTDTCTYIAPVVDPDARIVMTDSAKWAYYAPANLGVEVTFGSMAECVESAITGRLESIL